MNCKQGDLAVVVAAPYTPELIGAIVRVLRLAEEGELDGAGLPLRQSGPGPTWLVSGDGRLLPSRTTRNRLLHLQERFVADRLLRPIRDNPGADETLSWSDVPQKVTA